MRRIPKLEPRLVLEELPATLFVVYNLLMGWMAWTLHADISRWRGHLDAGELKHVPPLEPATSEAILSGLPWMWSLGAAGLALLALYWHAGMAGKSR